MLISSAKFLKSIATDDDLLHDGVPQIAMMGRSNVGKSSLINALTQQPGLAKSSPLPGKTKLINVFYINKNFYLIDLPGYGFAQGSHDDRDRLQDLINWYLFSSNIEQHNIIVIIDALVGPTKHDSELIALLREQKRYFVVVANKIDKIKKSGYQKQIRSIQDAVGDHKIFFCSTVDGRGVEELAGEMLR